MPISATKQNVQSYIYTFPFLYYLQFIAIYLFIYLFIYVLWLHLQHMEVPRLPAYATATPDPSHSSDLCCNLQQRQILNPLSEAWRWTHIFMDTSQILNLLNHNRNSSLHNYYGDLTPQEIAVTIAKHKDRDVT